MYAHQTESSSAAMAGSATFCAVPPHDVAYFSSLAYVTCHLTLSRHAQRREGTLTSSPDRQSLTATVNEEERISMLYIFIYMCVYVCV